MHSLPIRRFVLPAVTILCTAALLTAGPLDPPSGAIAPTYKTLNQVEPRTPITAATTPGDADSVYLISKPGSYYLVESMVAPAGKIAVEIEASNVTIDMRGFTISSLATLSAIKLNGTSRTNITIRDGHIGTCLGNGIDLTNQSRGGVIENIIVTGAAGMGIYAGNGFTLSNCSAVDCGSGIRVESGNTLINCAAFSNDGTGITTYTGTSLENCTASGNGYKGFVIAFNSTLSNCTAYNNEDIGFETSSSSLTGCTAYSNTLGGFLLSGGSATNCVARSNDYIGIYLAGASANNCMAISNGDVGIRVNNGSVIDCTANSNTLDGIYAFSSSLIRGNSCNFNDRAGIYLEQNYSRVLQNAMSSNVYGVRIVGASNIITGNTAAFSTTSNWYIVANNSIGPIIKVNKTASLINGDTAAGTMGSTDSNANFTH
jgi:parallel beta-helix repeat protein